MYRYHSIVIILTAGGNTGIDRKEMIVDSQKLFILNVKMENRIKRLYFKGTASPASEEKFQKLQEKIPSIGDESSGWENFVNNVVSYFGHNGFMRIQG